MESVWLWLVLGVAIIVALGSYAAYLLLALRRQRQSVRAAVQVQEAAPVSQALGAEESVSVLARCFLDGQVGASEAALRISVLLDQPQMPPVRVAQGQVFRDVAEALAHIPTHQQWQALSRQQRDQHRAEMENIEAENKEKMVAAAQRLSAAIG